MAIQSSSLIFQHFLFVIVNVSSSQGLIGYQFIFHVEKQFSASQIVVLYCLPLVFLPFWMHPPQLVVIKECIEGNKMVTVRQIRSLPGKDLDYLLLDRFKRCLFLSVSCGSRADFLWVEYLNVDRTWGTGSWNRELLCLSSWLCSPRPNVPLNPKDWWFFWLFNLSRLYPDKKGTWIGSTHSGPTYCTWGRCGAGWTEWSEK